MLHVPAVLAFILLVCLVSSRARSIMQESSLDLKSLVIAMNSVVTLSRLADIETLFVGPWFFIAWCVGWTYLTARLLHGWHLPALDLCILSAMFGAIIVQWDHGNPTAVGLLGMTILSTAALALQPSSSPS